MRRVSRAIAGVQLPSGFHHNRNCLQSVTEILNQDQMQSPFDRIIGHAPIKQLLTAALDRQRIAPAYLFVGPEGVGRRLLAEEFATRLLLQGRPAAEFPQVDRRLQAGNHPDFFRVEPTYLERGQRLTVAEARDRGLQRKAPPQIRIEQIREIARHLSRPPLESARSVVLLADAQTMPEPAANALLKTLEEPGRATLLLLAPAVESLLPTLVSRCQVLRCSALSRAETERVLQTCDRAEILAQPEILQQAQGSPGAAIAAWEQLQQVPTELLAALRDLPRSPEASSRKAFRAKQAFDLARQIDKTLESATQLWLLGYLQQCYWQDFGRPALLVPLERAREWLLAYAQPRLAWEVALLAIAAAITIPQPSS